MGRLVWVLLVAACGGPWGDKTFVDEGDLCFSEEADGVHVVVTAPDCLSSSCSRNVHGSCDAMLDGDRIEITSAIHWEEKHGPLARCTLDCGAATAECGIGELAPGTYTVVFGDDQEQLTVPITESCGPI